MSKPPVDRPRSTWRGRVLLAGGATRGVALRAVLLALVLLGAAAAGHAVAQAAQPARKPDVLVREIYVPFDDLNVLLEGDVRRTILTRAEYEQLLAKARQRQPDQPAPHNALLLAAEYEAVIEDGRARLSGTLELEVLADGLQAVPLALSGVGVRAAQLDDRPAALGRDEHGQAVLFVEGRGPHRLTLDLVTPLEVSAAQQTLSFRVPAPAAARLRLTVPGNVEIKSGASVVRREVDAEAELTRFELHLSPEQTALVMSLNNRLLQRQRVVVARSVLVDEVTAAFERLHATVSLGILHGAADRFRFVLPEGFEPAEVLNPLLARWEVHPGDQGRRELEVVLREPATETVVLNLTATRTPARLSDWTMPHLEPLDVAGQVAVVGVILDEQLKAPELTYEGLIPLDNAVLTAALPETVFRAEPGLAPVRPLAAFYAPAADYTLRAGFAPPPARLEVTTNLLLVMDETGHRVRGGFVILPEVEPRFELRFQSPPGWHVTAITDEAGSPLASERYAADEGAAMLRVRLPRGVPPGQAFTVLFQAQRVPPGWLGNWDSQEVEFPRFTARDADRDIGAIAVRGEDDLLVRPDRLEGLVPLDEKDKDKYGLAGIASDLAYRYDGQPYRAALHVARQAAAITARSYCFLQLAPSGLTAHYEIVYDVRQARARQLALRLPASTPTSLTIRGLEGIVVKEFGSEEVEGGRRWTILLAEPVRGVARLAVDFQQPLAVADPASRAGQVAADSQPLPPDEAVLRLPLVEAEGVAYQTAVVAVEGHADLDLDLRTAARRVDVGELAAAQYRPGRRLLGVYEFTGPAGEVLIDFRPRAGYGLPPAIVERAELVTCVSTSGVSQTAARYRLRTKSPFLEIRLPEDAELWSAYVDGRPMAPQADAGSLLISLPPAGQSAIRDLQIVYQAPVASIGAAGRLTSPAPRLLLRSERDGPPREVPAADLVWYLVLPSGHRLADSFGTVATDQLPPRRSPLSNVAAAVYWLGGGTHRIMAAREVRSGRVSSPAAAAPASARFEDYDQLAVTDEANERYGATEQAEPATEAPQRDQPAQPPQPTATPAPEQPPADDSQLAASEPASRTAAPSGDAELAQQDKRKLWALEGVRSLPIDLQQTGHQVTFRSLGAEPRLGVLVVNELQINYLAWGVAGLVLVLGIALTAAPAGRKAAYVIAVALTALALPAITGAGHELLDAFDAAFYAACLLVPYYLLVALVRRVIRGCCRWVAPAAGLLLVAMLSAGPQPAVAQQPPAFDPQPLIELLMPPRPIELPADAVVIPYDAADGAVGVEGAEQVLVPYAKYLELWNRAYPDQRLESKPPLVPWALAGAAYQATLAGDEYLQLQGHLDLEVFSEEEVQIPLGVEGAVLSSARLDGQPARLQVVQPASGPPAVPPGQQQAQQQPVPQQLAQLPQQVQPPPAGRPPLIVLVTSGQGLKRLELAVRIKLQRRGGWRDAAARLPAAPATSLTLIVPAARTEVRLPGLPDRREYETTADAEQIVTALPESGQLNLQWRPKVAEGQVDRSLTAESDAVLDVQEDGLRLAWRLQLNFPRSRRDAFSLLIPAGWLVETVAGQNVRGWELAENGSPRLNVTLLKEAIDTETLILHLSRRQAIPLAALPSQAGPPSRGGQATPDSPEPPEPPDSPATAGTPTTFDVPQVEVDGANLHKGRLTIRRSPLIELRADKLDGLSRTDLPDDLSPIIGGVDPAEESPLQLRPFQAYQFAAAPFAMQLTALPIPPEATAELQTLLRIAEREATVEARILLRPQRRPLHRIRVELPPALKIERIEPPHLEWAIAEQEGRRVLSVYLEAGRVEPFSLVVAGSLGRRQAGDPLQAPAFTVLDVERQQGDIVVQIDPAFDVRASDLQNCETVLLSRVFGWLQPEQRPLARLALHYESPGYQARLLVAPRQPRVNGFTITNVKVTNITVEETIVLDLTIRDAGLREIVFRLPGWLDNPRIQAPMLRQKTVEETADGERRVRLELQDEIIGQYRVLVENDRLLAMADRRESAVQSAPIPVLETGRTDQRYVTLEEAGRDEVQIVGQQNLQPLNRQQSEWRRLAGVLGEGITRAFLVAGDAAAPQLTYKTVQHTTVQTVGAGIGLAEAYLIVDTSGAFRGRQTYQVNNTTEQFLEIALPRGAELWTASVAGEPVKPAAVAGTPGRVRIPLIKTAEGDRDYPVIVKYGGRLRPPAPWCRLDFPLIHTVNINVELSHVRLQLPESYRWYHFGGTMRQAFDEGEFQAGYFQYNTKQVKRLMQVWNSDNPYARARVASNLKQLGLAVASHRDSNSSLMDSRTFRSNLAANEEALARAQQETHHYFDQIGQAEATDNRDRLNSFFLYQDNSLARNVVTDLGGNFRVPTAGEQPAATEERFRYDWLEQNQLDQSKKMSKEEVEERVQTSPAEKPSGEKLGELLKGKAVLKDLDQDSEGRAAGIQAGQTAEPSGRVLQTQNELAREYQMQLEAEGTQQQQLQQWRRGEPQSQTAPTDSESGPFGARGFGRASGMGAPGRPDAAYAGDVQLGIANGAAPEAAGAYGYWNGAMGGGMGGMGGGTVHVPPDFTDQAHLTSLDVQLPERGVEYLFTTARGDVQIVGRGISRELQWRLFRLAVLLAAALGLYLLYQLARRVGPALLHSTAGAILLIVVGLGSVLTLILPLFGLILLAAGIVLLLRRSLRPRSLPPAEPAGAR